MQARIVEQILDAQVPSGCAQDQRAGGKQGADRDDLDQQVARQSGPLHGRGRGDAHFARWRPSANISHDNWNKAWVSRSSSPLLAEVVSSSLAAS